MAAHLSESARKNPVEKLGVIFLALWKLLRAQILDLGQMLVFLFETLKTAFSRGMRWNLVMQQMYFIGVGSLFIVVLTGLFTGMVLALQTGRALTLFQAETLTGAVSGLSIARELGPVLTALMVTARAGSAMAAQLGTMKVTEQIDALISMAVHPYHFLILPRIFACVIVMPLLVAIFDFVGVLGSYLVGTQLLGINAAIFIERIRLYLAVPDLIEGLFKSIFFAVILATVSCYKGFHTKGGASGVGRSTTAAVVISSIAILVADYFLTAILF